jgi:hypothetical protein
MNVNYERKMVSRKQTYANFEGNTLVYVLNQVKMLIKEYGGDALIEGVCDHYSDSDRETLYVFKDEPETNEEMAQRIAQEEKYAKIAEERDAAEFKRLQEKFGAK